MNLKNFMGACAGMLVMTACSTQAPGSYTLSGHIEGLPDKVHVQLIPVSHDQAEPLADTVVTGGKFLFQGIVEEPLAVRLIVKNTYGSMPLMLESGKTGLEGKVISKNINGTDRYDFSQIAVKGSPLSDKYAELLQARVFLDSIYAANNERYKAVRAAYLKAKTNEDKALMDSVTATEAFRESDLADSLFLATVEAAYYKVVMDNKDSYWGPLMMITLFSYLTEEQKPWYDALSEEAKNSYYGKMVKEEVAPDTAVGSKVPDFTVKSKEGNAVTLTDLCKDKKYVLIDFWASWCAPCRNEIPNLKKLYAQYVDKGFEIVSISIDKKETDWTKALHDEQLQWPNFLDTENIANMYKVRSIPTMYLIDNQGNVVEENLRGEELANKLTELLIQPS